MIANRKSQKLSPLYKMVEINQVYQVFLKFVCVEVLWPSRPNGVMSSAVSSPNHTFTGQA